MLWALIPVLFVVGIAVIRQATPAACVSLPDSESSVVSFVGPNVVTNGDGGAGVLGWTAGSMAGRISLSPVALPPGSPASQAIDVQRGAAAGDWAWVTVDIGNPSKSVLAGHSYLLRAYVRDVEGSGKSIGMLLANSRYLHMPSPKTRYESSLDDGWRLIQFEFVANKTAHNDTAVYFELPGEGEFHRQIASVSLREIAKKSAVTRPPATNILRFAGERGTAPDPSVWSYQTQAKFGTAGTEVLTSSTSSSALDGHGNLNILTQPEILGGQLGMTSAQLTTENKVEVPSGSYVEVSIRSPVGDGITPWFSLVATNSQQIGPPAAGRLEVFGGDAARTGAVDAVIHMPSADEPGQDRPVHQSSIGSPSFPQEMDRQSHRYGVYFDENVVAFVIDGRLTMTYTAKQAQQSQRLWPFSNPMFIVLGAGSSDTQPDSAAGRRVTTMGAVSVWSDQVPLSELCSVQ